MERPDIETIGALEAQATPGPWHACHDGACPCAQVWSAPNDTIVHMPLNYDDLAPHMPLPSDEAKANAAFIAAARTAVPQMVAYIEALEAERKQRVAAMKIINDALLEIGAAFGNEFENGDMAAFASHVQVALIAAMSAFGPAQPSDESYLEHMTLSVGDVVVPFMADFGLKAPILLTVDRIENVNAIHCVHRATGKTYTGGAASFRLASAHDIERLRQDADNDTR
jgi:hypothetical protein